MPGFYEELSNIVRERTEKVNRLGVGGATFQEVYIQHFGTNPFYLSLRQFPELLVLKGVDSNKLSNELKAFLIDKGVAKSTFQKLKAVKEALDTKENTMRREGVSSIYSTIDLKNKLNGLTNDLNKELSEFVENLKRWENLFSGAAIAKKVTPMERIKLFFGWNPIEGWTGAALYRTPLNIAKILLVVPTFLSGVVQKVGDGISELDKFTGNTGFFKYFVSFVPYMLQRVFFCVHLFLRAGLSERESRGELFTLGLPGRVIHYVSMVASRSLMLGPAFMFGPAAVGVTVAAPAVFQGLGPVWTNFLYPVWTNMNVVRPAIHTFGAGAKGFFSAIGVQIPQVDAVFGAGIGLMTSANTIMAAGYRSAKKRLFGGDTHAKKETGTLEILQGLNENNNVALEQQNALNNVNGRQSPATTLQTGSENTSEKLSSKSGDLSSAPDSPAFLGLGNNSYARMTEERKVCSPSANDGKKSPFLSPKKNDEYESNGEETPLLVLQQRYNNNIDNYSYGFFVSKNWLKEAMEAADEDNQGKSPSPRSSFSQ